VWLLPADRPLMRGGWVVHVKKDKDRWTPHQDKDTHTHTRQN
jgi:hypothetical protein